MPARLRLLEIACVGAALAGLATATTARAEPPKWSPWVELGGYGGNERSRGEVALFAPLAQTPTSLFFTDIRGKLFEEEAREGNFAVGYRQMLTGGWNLGGWVGYDLRETELGSLFNQVAFGLEALHPDFDVRLNGYVPIEESETVDGLSFALAPQVQLVGNNIFLVSGGRSTTRELAFHGLDGEIGWRVPLGLDALADHEVRLYAGGFAFDNDEFDRTIVGPRARIEWRVADVLPAWEGSRLTLEAEYQWDEVRDDQVEGGVRLRLPFGATGQPTSTQRLTAQERRMAEALERDTDIVATAVTSKSAPNRQEKVEDADTNVDFDQVALVANGDDLQGAMVGVGANSLIIANGGAIPFDSTFVLNQQTLQGGGSTILVRGLETGLVAPFTAPGSRPDIVSCGCSFVVAMGSDTHIVGFDLTGDGGSNGPSAFNHGVWLNVGTSNVVIEDVAIRETAANGILIDAANSNVRIRNVVIDHTYESAIFIAANNTDISISNTSIQLAGTDGFFTDNPNAIGIRIDNNNTGITIADVSIFSATNSGIRIADSNQVTIARTSIDLVGNIGVEITDNNIVTLDRLSISRAFFDGLNILGVTPNTVVMTNTTFSDVMGDDVIDIGQVNNLSGGGNVSTATPDFNGFGGVFCNAPGGHPPGFAFISPPGTCPN